MFHVPINHPFLILSLSQACHAFCSPIPFALLITTVWCIMLRWHVHPRLSLPWDGSAKKWVNDNHLITENVLQIAFVASIQRERKNFRSFCVNLSFDYFLPSSYERYKHHTLDVDESMKSTFFAGVVIKFSATMSRKKSCQMYIYRPSKDKCSAIYWCDFAFLQKLRRRRLVFEIIKKWERSRNFIFMVLRFIFWRARTEILSRFCRLLFYC